MKERLRSFVFALFFGLVAIFLESTVFPSLFQNKIHLNLIFGMILWLGFFKSNPDGVLISFILAWLQGVASGSLSGVFLFAGMSLYLFCWISRMRFAPRTTLGQFSFALGLGLFYKLILLATFELFVSGSFFRVQAFGYFFLEILLNAGLSLLVYALGNRIKGFFNLIPEKVEPRRH